MNYPTWSDLNDASIVPPLGTRNAPDLGPVAVLVSPEPDLKLMGSLGGHKVSKASFFNSSLSRLENGVTLAGPYIGAPYGVILLDSLAARGVKKIIILGWCGGLTKDLSIGDLIIPDKAICDEGTSRHYRKLDQGLPCTYPARGLSRELARYLSKSGPAPGLDTIWTTDAIYRETPKKVDWYREKGARAVEMECSALFAAAAFRQIETAALLIVSDSLAQTKWDPGFKKKQFKAARNRACQAVLNFASQCV